MAPSSLRARDSPRLLLSHPTRSDSACRPVRERGLGDVVVHGGGGHNLGVPARTCPDQRVRRLELGEAAASPPFLPSGADLAGEAPSQRSAGHGHYCGGRLSSTKGFSVATRSPRATLSSGSSQKN